MIISLFFGWKIDNCFCDVSIVPICASINVVSPQVHRI